MILSGRCHCGQVTLAFDTALAPGELPLRRCQCSFCRKHGARTVADPNGSLTIAAEPAAVVRYRFGLATADFLLCARCGAYVAAILDGARATLNANLLDCANELTQPATPVDYDGETAEARRARRLRAWTPVRAAP